MQLDKLVAKFKNGTLIKGKSYDFFPQKTHFHVATMEGEIVNIDAEQLKAIYIVKSFKGDKNYHDYYNDIIPGGGQKIKVKFYDDETVIGYSLCYSSHRHGFFMTPADLRCNNKRIFVINSATRNIEFLESSTTFRKELIKQGI